MKKLVITGPECSGKSTLALKMSQTLKGVLVPEIARPLLMLTKNNYSSQDLTTIAEYQVAAEFSAHVCDNDWVICDTSMLVLKTWSQIMFGGHDPWIEQRFQHSSAWLWLLCQPLPHWEADGLRNNPDDRQQLFQIYQSELIRANKNFIIVPAGSVNERVNWVINEISDRQK